MANQTKARGFTRNPIQCLLFLSHPSPPVPPSSSSLLPFPSIPPLSSSSHHSYSTTLTPLKRVQFTATFPTPPLTKMGNCASNTREAEEKARSDLIDRQIDEDSKKYKRECKILLLGAYSLFSTLACHSRQLPIMPFINWGNFSVDGITTTFDPPRHGTMDHNLSFRGVSSDRFSILPFVPFTFCLIYMRIHT